MHQSAEKSTSTVAPPVRNSARRARENGSQGMIDSTGPRNVNEAQPIAAATPAAWTQRPKPTEPPLASCPLPIHQQAAQMPTSSANVGTNQS